jgi:hypothetical protein
VATPAEWPVVLDLSAIAAARLSAGEFVRVSVVICPVLRWAATVPAEVQVGEATSTHDPEVRWLVGDGGAFPAGVLRAAIDNRIRERECAVIPHPLGVHLTETAHVVDAIAPLGGAEPFRPWLQRSQWNIGLDVPSLLPALIVT